MILNEIDKVLLADIVTRHAADIQAAVEAAYAAGIFRSQHVSFSTEDPTAEPAAHTETLSDVDCQVLHALGINAKRLMTERNTTFTIVGYVPSRWKYPVSVKTQNGTRYKMSIEQIKRLQR